MPETVVASLQHSVESLFPPPLAQEDPPTVIAHANSMESWTKWNLKRALDSDVHFEHQLYGPDNTYLQEIFPVSRRFSIIPQALIRRVLPRRRFKPLNVSTGSSGGRHGSRRAKTKFMTAGKIYPDFLVVKIIPTREETPRQHYIVCVVEVKLGEKEYDREQADEENGSEDEDEEEEDEEDENVDERDAGDEGRDDDDNKANPTATHAETQMLKYMKTIANHPYRDPELRGFLLRGSKYLEYQLIGNKVSYTPGLYKDLYTANDPLTQALCEIAVQQWNRSTVDHVDLPGLD